MRMRSTGLGKTELLGKIDDITRLGDYLIIHVGTTEPVRWHVRTAVDMGDLFRIIRLCLKPSSLLFIVTHLFSLKAKSPPEY